jgi:hypothetical protein
MRTAFYTIVSDDYYIPSGTLKLVNSFMRFHRDIPLYVFRQDYVDIIFKKYGINFFMAKPYFGKLLSEMGYEKIVNIDSDSVVLGRMDAVLVDDYDFGTAWNFNDYENRHFENITDQMYLQAGLVASTKKEFWDYWIVWNKQSHKYLCAENDTLNLLAYTDPRVKDWKLKIFDKEKDYYGCKSLNREKEFIVEDNKIMCRGEQVLCYHNAKGRVMPKLQYDKMGFTKEVQDYMNFVSSYGTSYKIQSI